MGAQELDTVSIFDCLQLSLLNRLYRVSVGLAPVDSLSFVLFSPRKRIVSVLGFKGLGARA